MKTNKPWELFVIQHSHIDIGFTHRQELIERFRRDFLNQVLTMVTDPKQKTRGNFNKFKYTCEGFWAIEKFLERAGEDQKEELIRAFKEGSLELSPFYIHLTELTDEISFKASLEPALNFSEKHSIPIDTAMACDINGFTWGSSQIMYDAGIRYLSTSINSHHGGYPFNKPLTPFYWETPKGDKILSWVGLPYHKANLLGLVPSLSPDGNPGIPGIEIEGTDRYIDIKDISLAEKKIFPMLEGLAEQNYAYNFMPVMAGGLYTDNNPPIDGICEIIDQWNAKHGEKVRIRTASLKEFFTYVEENAGEIEVHKGDWTDWWADGVASTPAETALFRNAQRTRNVLKMLDPENSIIPTERIDEINNQLVLFAEHTWGHTNSNSPWSQIVQQSLFRKGKYAIDADVLASIALDDVKEAYGEGSFTTHRPFRYRVVNPLPITKEGLAYLPYDAWEVYKIQGGLKVLDSEGREYPFQIERKLREYFILIQMELKPGEKRDFHLEFTDNPITDFPVELLDNYFKGEYESTLYSTGKGFHSGILEIECNSFENEWYTMEWSAEKGIFSLKEKTIGKELINRESSGLFTPLYQRFHGGNRSDAAGFNLSQRKIPEGTIYKGKLKKLVQTMKGVHFTRFYALYEIEGAEYYAADIAFHHSQPRIDVTIRMTKDNVADPEGMYISFPFELNEGQWILDKTGEPIVPGRDQLPKACPDYFLIQNGAALTNRETGIALSIKDAPLVHIGKMRLWDFTDEITPVGTLFSWVTNNKWEVNFKSACGGFYEFSYTIETGAELSDPQMAINKCRDNLYDFISLRTD